MNLIEMLERIKDMSMPVISKYATDEEKVEEFGQRLDEIAEFCENEIDKLKKIKND